MPDGLHPDVDKAHCPNFADYRVTYEGRDILVCKAHIRTYPPNIQKAAKRIIGGMRECQILVEPI